MSVSDKAIAPEVLGPLSKLIGKWKGERGLDVSPESDGVEKNAYEETLEFKLVGDVTNAEEQKLGVVQYEQIVHRRRDGKLIHHQLGYWTWDKESKTVCNNFTIPRRVSVLATGSVEETGDEVRFNVEALNSQNEGGILEAPFMSSKATTTKYVLQLTVTDESLSYEQTSYVNIYAEKEFEHTDKNSLAKV